MDNAIREIPCPRQCGGTVTVLDRVVASQPDGTPVRWAVDRFVCDGCVDVVLHDIPNRKDDDESSADG